MPASNSHIGGEEITEMAWEESIWFSDIDSTLINTAAASIPGSLAIRTTLIDAYGEEAADRIQSGFLDIYRLISGGHRVKDDEGWQKVPGGKSAYDELMANIASLQPQVKRDYGYIKQWSREIFIKLAADKAGVDIDPELVSQAAEAYWMAVTECIEIFPDAKQLTDKIAEHNRPLYLVTSSDARLTMGADGLFTYVPSYSEVRKRQRIEALRDKGLQFTDVSIGDPEDKPGREFFTKAIRLAERDMGHDLDLSKAIMLGDFYMADLQTPKDKLGFGLVVLREKERTNTTVHDPHYISTGNLTDICSYLA